MITQLAIITVMAFHPGSPGAEICPPTEKKIDWKMIEETGNVTIYERWVQVEEDLVVRERKGVFIVGCPSEEVARIITDAKMATTWMKGVTDSYVISRNSESEWYAYTFYQIPWPFNDRDLVTRYRVTEVRDEGMIIRMESAEGIIEKKEDVERIEKFYGSWEITRLGPDRSRVTFIARTDTPPEYPRWLQDPIVKKAFIGNLEKLRELLNGQIAAGSR